MRGKGVNVLRFRRNLFSEAGGGVADLSWRWIH